MKIYELLKVPAAIGNNIEIDKNEVESIDFYTELSIAMYRVENDLLDNEQNENRVMWEFDEWGNLECYMIIDNGFEDGAPDCVTHLYLVKYAGYMIKIIDVIN